MAVRISLPTSRARVGSSLMLRLFAALAILVLLVAAVGASVFGYYYVKYQHIVDERMEKPLFANTAKIYAAPRQVRTGQRLTPRTIAQELRAAGYTEDGAGTASPLGTYAMNAESITVHPGAQSYHAPENATITFDGNAVSQITGAGGQQLSSYELEPVLITGLSDQTRTKRRLVTYDELPKYLVPAVTSIEDRRFFSHGGVDYIGVARAMSRDLATGRLGQGGSTLTMQLARGFFLTPEKHFKRKLIEIVITFQLEHRFSKQQIFQMYANQIPLGQQGSFAINGFGEAAQVFFGKDLSRLDLPECALLAGLIQSPSRLNPARHPARAVERRNVVLDAMVETGEISKAEAEQAKASPLKLAPPSVEQGQAPYFVDLVREQLSARLGDANWNQEGLRIYSSLDPDLQEAATSAVESGMKIVDAQVERPACQGRQCRRADHLPAGGAGRPRPAHRPGARAGRRPQLRPEPARPRGRPPADRVDLQAVYLRCSVQLLARRHPAPESGWHPGRLHPGHHARRSAAELRLRQRPDLHAAQLQGRVPR